jgi:hypothetical protein
MLYASTTVIAEFSGHNDGESLKRSLRLNYNKITEIQADGDELERCCAILGRQLPPCRVYTFLGNTAQEIACNWY